MSTTPKPIQGRTIRLHFKCHAEIPIGSYLRVTGSTLWAPSVLHSSTDQDPLDAKAAHHSTASHSDSYMGSSNINTIHDQTVSALLCNGACQDEVTLYTSSVEMVTSPEEYPVWRTKRPVTIVLTNKDDEDKDKEVETIMHRYRYMVVTPGAVGTNIDDDGSMLEPSTTSNDDEGTYQVMNWEDPFMDAESSRNLSSVSLPSLRKAITTKTLANLPFRSRCINQSFIVKNESDSMDIDDEEVPLDHWNEQCDVSFQDYLTYQDAFYKQHGNEEDMVITSDSGRSPISSMGGLEEEDEEVEDASFTKEDEGSTASDEPKQRLFLVCYHLPISLTLNPDTKKYTAQWSDSLISFTEGGDVAKAHDTHWVGTVSVDLSTEEEREEIRKLLEPMNCTPLFLNNEVKKAHYFGMCKQVLWPAFHNIDLMELTNSGWGQRDLTLQHKLKNESESSLQSKEEEEVQKVIKGSLISDWDQSRLDKWWDAYTAVNRAFANALSLVLEPMDIVWIHDYHLSLLPKMLHHYTKHKFSSGMSMDTSSTETAGGTSPTQQQNSNINPTPKMVFFLHIPFPTSQIFRELEFGEAILEGMLHADVVGFHAFDHARHFLNASKRILGLNYESLVGGLIGIQYVARTVLVTMSNVSIESDVVDHAMMLPSVTEISSKYMSDHEEKLIVSGIDIAQRLSGISLKLLAYERLLTDYPVWQNKIVMIQKCLLPGSRRADEINTIKEIRFLVRRIQEKFGRNVLVYEEVIGSSLPLDERCALWMVTDVSMFTTVREGLNMLPLEYTYARASLRKPGVTIASEFSAISSILNGALRVNPFDIQMVATNLDKALSMSDVEKEGRLHRDIDFVSSCPRDQWTRNVLRDLKDVTMQKEEEKSMMEAGTDSIAAFLMRESESAFNHVDIDALIKAYKASKRRVIVTDFNGTIVIKEPPGKYLKREILGTSGLKPPTAVVKALADMASDPANKVFVVSGDSQENVENALGHVNELGLAASNGACFSLPTTSGGDKRTWEYFDLGVDWDTVKKVALPIMAKYTARTNGSFVKLTHSSIGWSYYSCDPEWGSLQASHLVLELEHDLRPFDVRFVTLKGIVEIVPRRLNKGLVVKKVLREMVKEGKGDPDFILCVGDDISDEKMFTAVFSFVSELRNDTTPHQEEKTTAAVSCNNMYCFTLTVGKKPSHACQYVDDAPDVANMLIRLTGGDTSNRSMSWDNSETGADFFA